MEKKYEDWIAEYVKKWHGFTGGLCMEASRQMHEAFPELTIVKGWAHVVLGGRREHAWCVTLGGEVVDPTIDQFKGGVIEYEPWKPGKLVRMGRCMNCGDDIYGRPDSLDGNRKTFCSKECEQEMAADFNSGG